MLDSLISQKEITKQYGISLSTLYRWKKIYPDIFPTPKGIKNKPIKFSKSEFEAFLTKKNLLNKDRD